MNTACKVLDDTLYALLPAGAIRFVRLRFGIEAGLTAWAIPLRSGLRGVSSGSPVAVVSRHCLRMASDGAILIGDFFGNGGPPYSSEGVTREKKSESEPES